MSIQLKDLNVIIPRNIIDNIYSGGSLALIENLKLSAEFYDENIICFGAEDSIEIGTIIEEWTDRGLRDVRKRKGKRVWIDLCIVGNDQCIAIKVMPNFNGSWKCRAKELECFLGNGPY